MKIMRIVLSVPVLMMIGSACNGGNHQDNDIDADPTVVSSGREGDTTTTTDTTSGQNDVNGFDTPAFPDSLLLHWDCTEDGKVMLHVSWTPPAGEIAGYSLSVEPDMMENSESLSFDAIGTAESSFVPDHEWAQGEFTVMLWVELKSGELQSAGPVTITNSENLCSTPA